MARPPEADLENAMSIMKLLRAPPQSRACAYPRRTGFSEHHQPHHQGTQQHHPHHHHHLHHPQHHQSSRRHQQHPGDQEHLDGNHMSHLLSHPRHMSHPLELTRAPSSEYASAFNRAQTLPNPSCIESLDSANNGSSSRSKMDRSNRGDAGGIDISEPNGEARHWRICGSGGNTHEAHQRRPGSTFGSSNRSPPGVGQRRSRLVFSKSSTPSPCDDVFVL